VKASPASPPLSVGLRRYLYFTAAVTGSVIMIVEILGAKMLAPYVGTSHFVWTAQIAVTLLALATGYYAGGWLVDRAARLHRLYGCILAAAIYLCVSVLLVEPLAYWCLGFKLAAGSLLASACLFFVPLSLLAMVGPFFVRGLTVSVSGVGGNVGRLTAISTLGSVTGTVLIGYVLIPRFANSTTMLMTAGVLMAVSGGYLVFGPKADRQRASGAAGVVLGFLFAAGVMRREQLQQWPEMNELYRGNSNFGLLQVIEMDDGARRYYLNDYLTQNTYSPVEKQSLSMFTYTLHGLARAYTPAIRDALCIGMGVGIVPMTLAGEGAHVDVVEINPAVVPLAQRYFDCQPERFHLTIADGREFVNRCRKKYDAIILDAFLGDSCPSHLMTRESFRAMHRCLRPEGTLVINTFAGLEAGRDFFGASLEQTLKQVFRTIRIHAAGNGNVFFVASDRPALTMLHPPSFEGIPSSVRYRVEQAFEKIEQTQPAHGRVLTDNFNPVEFYDAANREETRRNLALGMQRSRP
jgi:spermidine synthase